MARSLFTVSITPWFRGVTSIRSESRHVVDGLEIDLIVGAIQLNVAKSLQENLHEILDNRGFVGAAGSRGVRHSPITVRRMRVITPPHQGRYDPAKEMLSPAPTLRSWTVKYLRCGPALKYCNIDSYATLAGPRQPPDQPLLSGDIG